MKELTVEQTTELFGEKLNSTTFSWKNYCGSRGVSVLTIFDTDDEIVNKRFIIQGWCNANNLNCNSKNSGFALMMWDKKEKNKIWCHISVNFSTTLFRKYELSKKPKQ